jgi:hypothetical protein
MAWALLAAAGLCEIAWAVGLGVVRVVRIVAGLVGLKAVTPEA